MLYVLSIYLGALLEGLVELSFLGGKLQPHDLHRFRGQLHDRPPSRVERVLSFVSVLCNITSHHERKKIETEWNEMIEKSLFDE